MYYYAEATMKQIGDSIGVNESRVSQLHARAVQRLRRLLMTPAEMPAPRLVAKSGKAKFKRTMAPTMAPKRRIAARMPDDRRAVA